MKRFVFVVAATLALAGIAPAQADDVMVGALKISTPWSRATPKGAGVGAGYFTVTNTGTAPDRLVSGASDASKSVEIHEMAMENNVMKMRELANGIEIKPGETIEFKPGSYHIMFMGLNKQFVQGEAVKATLQFEKAGKADLSFAVQGIGAQAPAAAAPAHGGMGMQHGH